MINKQLVQEGSILIEIREEVKIAVVENMTSNLATLRTMLHLSQAELALLVGLGRQSLVSIETGKRKMTWSVYLSLLFVFSQNKQTAMLLDVFEIYPSELKDIYTNIK